MRVLVSVDMEGAAGVVDGEDVSPGTGEYERNRLLLTEEANAAVRGVYAFDPGAEVLVTEAHGPFRNLVPELLDRRAELLRGKPKPDGMLAGIADRVDAALFIGYHGKAGTARSVLAHTIHGGVVADVRCDGRDARGGGEAALGGRAAALLHPQEARDRIEREVPPALADRASVRAPRFDGPLTLEVDVLKPYMTERAQLVPGVELAGDCTLRYAAPDFPAAYRVTQVITMLAGI